MARKKTQFSLSLTPEAKYLSCVSVHRQTPEFFFRTVLDLKNYCEDNTKNACIPHIVSLIGNIL